MLQPQVFSDHEAVSAHAADWLAVQLRERPDALWCLATGATPMRTYELLARRPGAATTLFEQVRLLKLDEWGGLPVDDPATCETHLRSTLVNPLGLSDRYIAFDSQPADPTAECVRIARWLQEQGPIDVCVLGLGVNGHLGFNEPADELQAHAHVAALSPASLSHTMLDQSAARPAYGLTLGMTDLLQSRQILLLVTGPKKQQPLERLLSGAISTGFPASLLQLHPAVVLLCDEAAHP